MTDTNTTARNTPDRIVMVEGMDEIAYRVGAIFHHEKGTGLNILIGKSRYAAFQPKNHAPANDGKARPLYYVFVTARDGRNYPVGAIFKRGKSKDWDIVIGESRYIATLSEPLPEQTAA